MKSLARIGILLGLGLCLLNGLLISTRKNTPQSIIFYWDKPIPHQGYVALHWRYENREFIPDKLVPYHNPSTIVKLSPNNLWAVLWTGATHIAVIDMHTGAIQGEYNMASVYPYDIYLPRFEEVYEWSPDSNRLFVPIEVGGSNAGYILLDLPTHKIFFLDFKLIWEWLDNDSFLVIDSNTLYRSQWDGQRQSILGKGYFDDMTANKKWLIYDNENGTFLANLHTGEQQILPFEEGGSFLGDGYWLWGDSQIINRNDFSQSYELSSGDTAVSERYIVVKVKSGIEVLDLKQGEKTFLDFKGSLAELPWWNPRMMFSQNMEWLLLKLAGDIMLIVEVSSIATDTPIEYRLNDVSPIMYWIDNAVYYQTLDKQEIYRFNPENGKTEVVTGELENAVSGFYVSRIQENYLLVHTPATFPANEQWLVDVKTFETTPLGAIDSEVYSIPQPNYDYHKRGLMLSGLVLIGGSLILMVYTIKLRNESRVT